MHRLSFTGSNSTSHHSGSHHPTLGHFEPFQPIPRAVSQQRARNNTLAPNRFFQAARNLDLIQEDDIQVTLDPSLTDEWWKRIRLGNET